MAVGRCAITRRAAAMDHVLDSWPPSLEQTRGNSDVLILDGGKLDRNRLDAMLRLRDDRPAAIAE